MRDRVSAENVVILEPIAQPATREVRYVPPITVLLRGLGITELDLRREKVTVSTAFLRFIVSQLVRRAEFDPDWYAERYPDVEGARLAGQVPSLHEHYCTQGYFEGRVPCDLDFDPEWYYSAYQDVSRVFSPDETEAMHQHFRSQGWREGRAGTPDIRKEAERWLEAASKKC